VADKDTLLSTSPIMTPTPTMSGNSTLDDPTYLNQSGIDSREWLSLLLMTIGWFLLLSSLLGYFRVKRWEKSIQASRVPASSNSTSTGISWREQISNVRSLMRRNRGGDDDPSQSAAGQTTSSASPPMHHDPEVQAVDEYGRTIIIPSSTVLEEARLTRTLRLAGLIL